MHALEATNNIMTGLITTFGNVALVNSAKPYEIEFHDGAKLVLSSLGGRRHLTYLLILNAVKCLMEVLIYQHHYNEVFFDIIAEGAGLMGSGTFRMVP